LAAVVVVAGAGGLIWALKVKKSAPEQPGPETANMAAPTELPQVLADLDRREPGWRLDGLEAQRKVLPPEQNAALAVLAARRVLDVRAILPQLQETVLNRPPPMQLDAQQTASLRAVLQKMQPALAEARRVVDLPPGRHRITYARDGISTLLPHALPTREVADLLALDAALRAQEGDPEGALASCQAGLNVARSLWDEPGTISQLVRLACQAVALNSLERILAQGEPLEKSLAATQRLLEDEVTQPVLLIMARGELGFVHAAMTALQSGELKLADLLKATNLQDALITRSPRHDPPLAGDEADVQRVHAWLLRHLTRFVEIARLPTHEQQHQIEQWVKAVQEAPPLAKVVLVAGHKLVEACQRSRAKLSCAAAAAAAERYRRRHGRWPDALEALVPGQLARVPADPYDGRLLRYGRHAEGVVVYAVGPDRQDNGGTFDDQDPGRAGTDLGFRLWEVPQRRQPAPPGKQ
jgi:hypothetical protein